MLNKGILVTRPDTLAMPLMIELKARGARVWHFPTLQIHFLSNEPQVQQTIKALTDYSWQIFVSRHAVQAVLPQIINTWSMLDLKPLHWAAVGPGTAKELGQFISYDIVYPHTGLGADALLMELKPKIHAQDKLLVWCGDKPTGHWPQAKQICCYHREKNTLKSTEIAHALSEGDIDYVIINSASSLEYLIEVLGVQSLNRCTFIVISERIRQRAKELGLTGEIIISPGADDQSIIQTIKRMS